MLGISLVLIEYARHISIYTCRLYGSPLIASYLLLCALGRYATHGTSRRAATRHDGCSSKFSPWHAPTATGNDAPARCDKA